MANYDSVAENWENLQKTLGHLSMSNNIDQKPADRKVVYEYTTSDWLKLFNTSGNFSMRR